MPNLSIPRLYEDGVTPKASDFDTAFDAIETFFNVIGVDSSNIQDGAITAALIQDNTITNSRFQNDSITTAKLADASISPDKFSSAVQSKFVPVGALIYWPSATAPNGYLLCDGAAVSRTTYAELFAVMGTSHGAGDGTTTFNLPDLRGLFIRGQDDGSGRDPGAISRTALLSGGATGDNVGSYQPDLVGDHGHTQSSNALTPTTVGGSILSTLSPITLRPWESNVYLSLASGGGADTRPKNLAEHICIKVN